MSVDDDALGKEVALHQPRRERSQGDHGFND